MARMRPPRAGVPADADLGKVAPGSGASEVDRVARRTLREFGFPDDAVTRFERLPQGIKNLNYRVGADGRDWVLKCHQGVDMAARRANTHVLELALHDAGAPVAELRRTTSGGTLVRTELGVFTVHSWIDGRQISIADRDATHRQYPRLADELGAMLGTIHRASGGLRTGAPALTARFLVEGPRRSVASIRHGRPQRFRKVARLRLSPRKSSFDDWILASLPGLYRDAAALASPEVWSGLTGQHATLDHNDLNWENLVFAPGFELAAVLDFDNAAVVPRDLAIGGAAAVLVGPDAGRVDCFVSAYARVADATPDPWAVNVGMHLKCLQSTLRSIDAYLSRRVVDPTMLEPWCRHLQSCRLALPPVSPSR